MTLLNKPTTRVPAKGPITALKPQSGPLAKGLSKPGLLAIGSSVSLLSPLLPPIQPLTSSQRLGGEFFVGSGNLSEPAATAWQKALDGGHLSTGEIETLETEQFSNPVLQTPLAEAAIGSVIEGQRQQHLSQGLAALGTMASMVTGSSCGLPTVGSSCDELERVTPLQDPPVTEDEITDPNEKHEIGMKILQVLESGAAEEANLQANDILYSVNGQRVRNYEEFRDAVKSATGAVEVVFFNAETKQLEKMEAKPQGGLLGVVVVEGAIPNP